MDTLLLGNLQCMYYGAFSQEMADSFVSRHLLNPEEFWTPLPLPSIAANDPLFTNDPLNDWSGQPQALSYQRAVQALENYGYEAELRLLGKKWIGNLLRTGRLVQQYDPFTGEPGKMELELRLGPSAADGYGPAVLAALEYISRLYGVDVSMERVRWSAVRGGPAGSYTQEILGRRYTLEQDGKTMRAFLDGRELFSCSAGVTAETDLDGWPAFLCGIEEDETEALFRCSGKSLCLLLHRNERYDLSGFTAALHMQEQ